MDSRAFRDFIEGFRKPINALAWVVLAVALTFFGMLALAVIPVAEWVQTGSKIILVAFSTAFFTRFMGGMGMFKDAISDVLAEDGWLERRKDVDELWRRLSRRIFLPGFKGTGFHDKRFVEAVNDSMNRVIHRKPENKGQYYQRAVHRHIRVKWHDKSRFMVAVHDDSVCQVHPFDPPKGCAHSISARPTSDQDIASVQAELTFLTINAVNVDLPTARIAEDNDEVTFPIAIPAGESSEVVRNIRYLQKIDVDPIYFVLAGPSVVWGMTARVEWEDGLHVVFEEVGVEREFREVGPPRRHELTKTTDSALLPDQGFLLVVMPVTSVAGI